MKNCQTRGEDEPIEAATTKVTGYVIAGYCVIVVVTVALFLFAQYKVYNRAEILDSTIFHEEHELQYGFDQILQDSDQIAINGWAVFKEERIYTVDISIVLQSESGIFFRIPTQYVPRPDIVAYLGNEEMDYQKSGFQTNFPKKFLDSSESYRIYILYRNNGHNCLYETLYNTDGNKV